MVILHRVFHHNKTKPTVSVCTATVTRSAWQPSGQPRTSNAESTESWELICQKLPAIFMKNYKCHKGKNLNMEKGTRYSRMD